MKYFKITLVICFFFSAKIFSNDIDIIELHSSSSENDIIFNNEINESINIDETEENTVPETSIDEITNQEIIVEEDSEGDSVETIIVPLISFLMK